VRFRGYPGGGEGLAFEGKGRNKFSYSAMYAVDSVL
jgi:hypothetical protein